MHDHTLAGGCLQSPIAHSASPLPLSMRSSRSPSSCRSPYGRNSVCCWETSVIPAASLLQSETDHDTFFSTLLIKTQAILTFRTGGHGLPHPLALAPGGSRCPQHVRGLQQGNRSRRNHRHALRQIASRRSHDPFAASQGMARACELGPPPAHTPETGPAALGENNILALVRRIAAPAALATPQSQRHQPCGIAKSFDWGRRWVYDIDECSVMISDPGKTVIDCIDHPGLADSKGEAAPVMATACRSIDRQPSDWRTRHSCSRPPVVKAGYPARAAPIRTRSHSMVGSGRAPRTS